MVEQSFSSDNLNLRPDLVVRDQDSGSTIVVNVTIPYESGEEAFGKAGQEKVQKYEGLRQWLEGQPDHSSVSVYPFIVGALGGWDENNRNALQPWGWLGITLQTLLYGCHQRPLIGHLEGKVGTNENVLIHE